MTLFIVEAGTTEDLDSGRSIPKVTDTFDTAKRFATEALMEVLEAATDESVQVAAATALDDLQEQHLRFSAAFSGFEVDISPVGSDPDDDLDEVLDEV